MISKRHTSLVLGGSWGRNERPAHIDVWHEASAETLRYVPERTCRYVYDGETAGWRCSECGGLEPVGDHVRYCPDCGARIEDEVDE